MADAIGRVIATEKAPTTIDVFNFWTQPETILHPFDVVKVDHLGNSITYGVIEEISHITDSASFLSSFISNDFGDVNTTDMTFRVGMNYVTVKVVGNSKNIDSPVINNSKVYLADAKEVKIALGLDNIKNPIICGYLEMYEDVDKSKKITLPVPISSDFLIGPEGAHLNIGGISGLAAKTSYAMFLLKAIQDKYIKLAETEEDDDNSVAVIAINVKGKDLLAVDEINDFSTVNGDKEKVRKETLEKYKELGLSGEPFKNVKYFYPASYGDHRNTYVEKERFEEQYAKGKALEYKFTYEKDKQNLDLLFSNIDDPNQTIDSIINYIISEQGKFSSIVEWDSFVDAVEEMGKAGGTGNKEIPVLSWRKFSRLIKKTVSDNALFGHINDGETRIGDAIRNIKANDMYVIDMAKLDSNMQAFVFGNIIREVMDYQLGEKEDEGDRTPPSRIIIFIDELNKYASTETPKNSPILRQILEIAERGRSLGVVLFGAEQFMSAIHPRVTGNCATFAYGRTNAIEVSKKNYTYVPKVYQNMMTRLTQGEYMIQSFCFNSLIKIKFPLPIYKQFK